MGECAGVEPVTSSASYTIELTQGERRACRRGWHRVPLSGVRIHASVDRRVVWEHVVCQDDGGQAVHRDGWDGDGSAETGGYDVGHRRPGGIDASVGIRHGARRRAAVGQGTGWCSRRRPGSLSVPFRVGASPRFPPDWDGRRDRLLPWSWWRALPGMDSRGRGNDGGRGFGVIRVMGEIGMIGTWMGRMDADEGRAGDWIQAPYRRTGQAPPMGCRYDGGRGLGLGLRACDSFDGGSWLWLQ